MLFKLKIVNKKTNEVGFDFFRYLGEVKGNLFWKELDKYIAFLENECDVPVMETYLANEEEIAYVDANTKRVTNYRHRGINGEQVYTGPNWVKLEVLRSNVK